MLFVADRLYCTVGCHPTQCDQFQKIGEEEYLQQLSSVCENNINKVVAIGECGLDYDRTQFCLKEIQLRYGTYCICSVFTCFLQFSITKRAFIQ